MSTISLARLAVFDTSIIIFYTNPNHINLYSYSFTVYSAIEVCCFSPGWPVFTTETLTGQVMVISQHGR